MESKAVGPIPFKALFPLSIEEGRLFFNQARGSIQELRKEVSTLVQDPSKAYQRVVSDLSARGEALGGQLDQFARKYPCVSLLAGTAIAGGGLAIYLVCLPLELETIITSSIASPLSAPLIITAGVVLMLATQASAFAVMSTGARLAFDGLIQIQQEIATATEDRSSLLQLYQAVTEIKSLSPEEKNEVRREWAAVKRLPGQKIERVHDRMQEILVCKLAEKKLLEPDLELNSVEKIAVKREWRGIHLTENEDLKGFALRLERVYERHVHLHRLSENENKWFENLLAGTADRILLSE